jgi:tetratricopeptide (TPR) repeat protein
MNRNAVLRTCLALLAMAFPLAAAAQQWGLQVRNAPASAGAEVTDVGPGTPAETAGIRPGDLIIQAQGRPVANALQFTQALLSAAGGTSVTMTVSRQGWERDVRLTVTPTPLSFGLTAREGSTGAGPVIATVAPDGSAAVAGLQPGDVVSGAEGRRVGGAAALMALLQDFAARSRPVTLTVVRQDWAKEVTLSPKATGGGPMETAGSSRSGGNANPPPATAAAPPPAAVPPVDSTSGAMRDRPASALPDIAASADVIAAVRDGNRAYETGNWREAEIYFRRALQAEPEEPRAWGRLCHAQVMQSRFVEAVETCQRAARLAPTEPNVFQNVGYSLFRLGNAADAIVWYQKAVAIAPDWSLPYAGMGASYFALRNWPKAEESYKLVVARDPRDQSAWQALGDAAGEQGKSADAIADYRKALEIGPANADLQRGLGWQLYREGRLADAEKALNEADRLNPKDAHTLVALGVVEYRLGKAGPAQQAWQRASELDPGGALGSIARQNLSSLATRQARDASTATPGSPATAQASASPAPLPQTARAPDTPAEQPLLIDDPDFDIGK